MLGRCRLVVGVWFGLLFLFLGCDGAPVGSVTDAESSTTKEAASRVDIRVVDTATNRPIEVTHGGYVSSRACLECHPDEHESWSDSYHRTMTQLVTSETALGKFDGAEREFYGWRFRPMKDADGYWMHIASSSGSRRFRHKLVMSTGSHHMQKYWYHTGQSRKLGLAPLVYLMESDEWVPEHTAFLRPTESGLPLREGTWNHGCNQCHATGSLPRITGPDHMDTQVAEFGISCEACHGPGAKHVSEKTTASIVNPRRLKAERSSQVCGQCHGAWVMEQAAGEQWVDVGHIYRPGDDLFKTRHYVHGAQDQHLHAQLKAEDSFWSDGENRVAGREFNGLLESPCYAHDQGEQLRMTCISCHDLHNSAQQAAGTWRNDQLAGKMSGNAACTQCHESLEEAASLVQHTYHLAGSSGSLCYNCHMPYTSYGLMKAVRSHTITSPSVAASLATGRPNACNQCHLDQTLGWTSAHLAERYGHLQPELSTDQRNIAASLLWALKGDAGQRALMAWSMGWSDAQHASGTDWMAFFLTDLMFDDYDAVRYIARRSLRQIDGFESLEFDHMRPNEERDRVMNAIMAAWQQRTSTRPTAERLLYDEGGNIQLRTYQRLRQQRNNRKVVITE